jgi:hypothetical protein
MHPFCRKNTPQTADECRLEGGNTVGRYVLRFKGRGAIPDADLSRIRSAAGVTLVDNSSRMFLVEASPQAVEQLAEQLPGWICSTEQTVPLPDSRRRIRSP